MDLSATSKLWAVSVLWFWVPIIPSCHGYVRFECNYDTAFKLYYSLWTIKSMQIAPKTALKPADLK